MTVPMDHKPSANLTAALDLGSNSFHLLVAEATAHGWRPQLRLGEKVQLAAGLQGDHLSLSAIERGLACLQRLAPHLRELPTASVRVVGTHTLRVARNRELFIEPAQRVLGHPVEVISGEEEAALIYRGVADARDPRCQLAIDIGGGSTELALGSGGEIIQLASVPIGCVTQRNYFPAGALRAELFEQAYHAACASVRAHWPQSLPTPLHVLGSSGTLLAIEQVLTALGLSDGGIRHTDLLHLRESLLAYDQLDAVQFAGLSESRRSVFATGVVIALALFDTLGIERIALSQAALREGVVAELLLRRAGALA